MIGLSVNAADVIAALTRAPLQVTQEVDAALGQGAVLIQREARRIAEPRQASGSLFDGIRAIRESALQWVVESTATEGGRPYAVYVEEGIRGGLHQQLSDSALAAIATWIKRKGIQPQQGDRTTLSQRRQLIESRPELVWLIGRKIARQGIKARPYMQPAFDARSAEVVARITAGVSAGLKSAGLAS